VRDIQHTASMTRHGGLTAYDWSGTNRWAPGARCDNSGRREEHDGSWHQEGDGRCKQASVAHAWTIGTPKDVLDPRPRRELQDLNVWRRVGVPCLPRTSDPLIRLPHVAGIRRSRLQNPSKMRRGLSTNMVVIWSSLTPWSRR